MAFSDYKDGVDGGGVRFRSWYGLGVLGVYQIYLCCVLYCFGVICTFVYSLHCIQFLWALP